MSGNVNNIAGRSGAPTPRTAVKRLPGLAVYDRNVIYAILDEALCCHVGFVDGEQPFVIPTNHARINDMLYFHGSPGSRMLRCLASGASVCVTVTLLDGLVLARSLLHHSMNYRSVTILGRGSEVKDREQKWRALEALTEHVTPGRWNVARQPSEQELAVTMIVSFPINEASAKIRTGPPLDEEADYALPVWAGVIPLSLDAGEPVPDPRVAEGIELPAYLREYGHSRGDGRTRP